LILCALNGNAIKQEAERTAVKTDTDWAREFTLELNDMI
jgi:hypothetical protein